MALVPAARALPGQALGTLSGNAPGPGTHTRGSTIYASIAGAVSRGGQSESASGKGNKPTLSVLGASLATSDLSAKMTITRNILPQVNAQVLARVTRIQPRQATVAILVVGEAVCEDEFQGVIRYVTFCHYSRWLLTVSTHRVQDVRATEKDKVKIVESFRPGDIVRAQVVCPCRSLVLLRFEPWIIICSVLLVCFFLQSLSD